MRNDTRENRKALPTGQLICMVVYVLNSIANLYLNIKMNRSVLVLFLIYTVTSFLNKILTYLRRELLKKIDKFTIYLL